jgi:hypothetical protein
VPHLPVMSSTAQSPGATPSPPLASVEARTYIAGMVRLSINPAAFDAIAATMPLGSAGFENARDSNGDWLIWLPHDVLAKLNRLRGPGESYSDAILALAEASADR